MTDTERQDGEEQARLDAALRGLSRSGLEPRRDLWPDIAAQLEPRDARPASRRAAWAWQAAAAVLLVAASSLLTARWMDSRPDEGTMATTTPAVTTGPADLKAVPAAFGPGARLDAEYLEARRQLTAMLESRMANLPESARAKLEVNLAELRRAAQQINAALAEQPGDPLLEELLLTTYQDELAVLANVNQLAGALNGTAEPADPKRMQL
jgi:hypothetical protein